MHPAVPICLVFLACGTNVIFLEFLVRKLPGSVNLVTFSQFVFIATEGFLFTANCGRKKPTIPIKSYVYMVSLFFVIQVVNNQALNYNISMPLHMIFKSGSLVANLLLGMIILKRSYSCGKYLSVVLITAGILTCTLASAGHTESHPSHTGDPVTDMINWSIGIGMLLFSLLASARLGIFQEQTFTKFGKHPKEAMFYNHALPLPGFLLVSTDIYRNAVLMNNSTLVQIPFIEIAVPKMWLYLFVNVISQYICIRSVFTLTAETSSLTVTMVLTIRKFLSLVFSILYFKNPFTWIHWIGTVFVFGGSLMFAELLPVLKGSVEDTCPCAATFFNTVTERTKGVKEGCVKCCKRFSNVSCTYNCLKSIFTLDFLEKFLILLTFLVMGMGVCYMLLTHFNVIPCS